MAPELTMTPGRHEALGETVVVVAVVVVAWWAGGEVVGLLYLSPIEGTTLSPLLPLQPPLLPLLLLLLLLPPPPPPPQPHPGTLFPFTNIPITLSLKNIPNINTLNSIPNNILSRPLKAPSPPLCAHQTTVTAHSTRVNKVDVTLTPAVSCVSCACTMPLPFSCMWKNFLKPPSILSSTPACVGMKQGGFDWLSCLPYLILFHILSRLLSFLLLHVCFCLCYFIPVTW